MEELKLFFSKQRNEYYYIGDPICDYCNNQIGVIAIFKIAWNKVNHLEKIACKNCFNKKKKDIKFKANVHRSSEIKSVILLAHVNELPKDAQPVFPINPHLATFSGDTTIEAAYKESETVINKTKLAGKESWEGAKIGIDAPQDNKGTFLFNQKAANDLPFKDYNEFLEFKKQNKKQWLDNKQLDNVLDNLKNAQPLIENKETKLLGVDINGKKQTNPEV